MEEKEVKRRRFQWGGGKEENDQCLSTQRERDTLSSFLVHLLRLEGTEAVEWNLPLCSLFLGSARAGGLRNSEGKQTPDKKD